MELFQIEVSSVLSANWIELEYTVTTTTTLSAGLKFPNIYKVLVGANANKTISPSLISWESTLGFLN